MEKPVKKLRKKSKSQKVSIDEFMRKKSLNQASLQLLVSESNFVKKNLKYSEKENIPTNTKKKKKGNKKPQKDLLTTVLAPKTSRSQKRSSSFASNLYDKYRTHKYSGIDLMASTILSNKVPKKS
jgi:hypothetical protein